MISTTNVLWMLVLLVIAEFLEAVVLASLILAVAGLVSLFLLYAGLNQEYNRRMKIIEEKKVGTQRKDTSSK